MLKTTPYVNNDLKIYNVFRNEIKATQITLQQIIA